MIFWIPLRNSNIDPTILLEHFWNVFVVDALLGNFDRHNGNWGFLYYDATKTATLAPVYDCGSCLLPQADERIMNTVLNNDDELNARIYRFPTSAIKVDGRKINYYDFLQAAKNQDCNDAVMRMAPKINMDEICAFVEEVPSLDATQKRFYQVYLTARHQRIIEPAYVHLLDQQRISPTLEMQGM